MTRLHLYRFKLNRPNKLAVCTTNVTRAQTTNEVAKVTCKTCRAWLAKRGIVTTEPEAKP